MTLANEDLPQLKSYFYEWLAEADSSRRPGAFELSLQERLIRVEESLSNQIELTRQGFSAMDKRFEGMQEKMDKRFEAFQGQLDVRFEVAQGRMDKSSTALQVQLDNRFEAARAQTDSRFEAMQTHLDKRFDAIGSDVRNLSQRMDKFMLWSFSTTVAGSGLVITVLKLWPPV
jgi:chaperonin cofactor prefoldin